MGFGFFWPYKVTLSSEGISTHTFFNTDTIKYVGIIEVKSTRSATRGGKLRDNYNYTIKAKDREVSFDQNSFPNKHKLIVSKIVDRAELRLISTQESGGLYQIWQRNTGGF